MDILIRILLRLALRFPLGQIIIGALLGLLGLVVLIGSLATPSDGSLVITALFLLAFSALLLFFGIRNMGKRRQGGFRIRRQQPYGQPQGQQYGYDQPQVQQPYQQYPYQQQ